MNAEWCFSADGLGDAFECAEVAAILEELLLLIAPEFTIGDIEIGDAIEALCMDGEEG